MVRPIDSFSSSLMAGITLYRNQRGISNKIEAELGYAAVTLVAVIETVVAAVFALLSLPLLFFTAIPLALSIQRLKSSAFCIPWSVVNLLLNPFHTPLVADEKSARKVFASCDLKTLPHKSITSFDYSYC